ncbi:MAG: ATPase domain-containing protein [Euryarchaeota archaeon]|nr:ATPase domain-containing protein [Euryarchaeota archaeon]
MYTGIKEFDRITGGIPDKNTILVEEELGSMKSIFAQKVASETSKNSGKVLYITRRRIEEITEEMMRYGMKPDGIEFVDTLYKGDYDLIIMDHFSITFVHSEIDEIINILNDLKISDAAVLLLSDIGILGERQESVARAMVDGVIRFRFEDHKDRIYRTIIIPKFRNAVDAIIPFTIDESGISIDTRKRF